MSLFFPKSPSLELILCGVSVLLVYIAFQKCGILRFLTQDVRLS